VIDRAVDCHATSRATAPLVCMTKKTNSKKLRLDLTTIAPLTNLEQVAAGLMLTRPYTKLSVCVGGNCATELCY